MTTENVDQNQPKPWYRKWWVWAIVVVVIVAIAGGGGDDDSTETAAENTPETTTEITTKTQPQIEAEETPAEDPLPANLAEGVDPYMGPQEWWDEYYRERHCVSQDIRFDGLTVCMARGVDMADNDTRLVFFVNQDEPGVQEHFEMEQRRAMFTQSLAEIISFAKFEGEPRLQHVQNVRVIATGGEGFLSGWQDEADVQ